MTKLYLLKSDHDREKKGDIIVVLDKVLTVRAFKDDEDYTLYIDYTSDDTIKAWFKDKNNLIKAFKELVSKLGGDESLVDDYVICEKNAKKDELARLLGKIKSSLET